ncbi:MAG: HAMP domain-containing histidine kinase [Lachnospiraceae bacterium]|nr:HAMP domain-containing histidine kinase [Lachnospiraceae bacterium]
MKKTSLRWKTVNMLFVLVALAFVIGFVLCTIFSTRFFVSVKQRSMKELYELLNSDRAREEVEAEVFALCEEDGITLLVKDSAGEQVYSFGHSETMSHRLDDITFGENEGLGNDKGSKVVSENSNYTLQIVNHDDKESVSYIEMWGFLDNGNSFIARSSLTNIQNNIRVSLSFFAIVCAAILVICAVAIYFIIGYYSKPITRLALLSQKVNEGDFDSAEFAKNYEYKHLRQDEIGVLGENIREISEKLEKNIAELKSSNLNLENELKRKTELEEARKKYMSDVSHELKTPIALISGYAEGLKEGISSSPEDRDFYCDVIIDEAEKMNVIIKRLSTLNQLEEGKSAVSLERFNVVSVINGFLNTMSVIIEEKGANIFFDTSRNAYVWSDEFLFEEVLVNYFNNALNHMNEEKIIRINVEKVEENIRVTVFNSGDNIPEDELDNIWGKFYKVDKARTREYGGSGLGLSIVKAVADSLNKSCGVQNLPDGVAFWIDLESAQGQMEEMEDNKPSVETAPKRKLTDLPIWQKTASTASKIISSTTKIIDKQSIENATEKPEKRKPKKNKAEKDKTVKVSRRKEKKESHKEPVWKVKEEENHDASDQ